MKLMPCFLVLVIWWSASLPTNAQSKFWRVGIAYQAGNSLSRFSKDASFPNQRIGFTVRPADATVLTAERNLSNRFRINISVGTLPQRIGFLHTARYIIPGLADQIYGGETALYFRDLPFGGVGFSLNSQPYGPFTLVVGADVLARYTSIGNVVVELGGTDTGMIRRDVGVNDIERLGLVEDVDFVRVRYRISYQTRAVPALSVAVSPRLGVEMQVLDKVSIYLGAVATLGLGPIVSGQGLIDFNGEVTRSQYGHNGSFWGMQVGAKYHLWRGKSTKKLHY